MMPQYPTSKQEMIYQDESSRLKLKVKIKKGKKKFLNHGKIMKVKQLNNSRLHLNKSGTQVLSNGFAESLI